MSIFGQIAALDEAATVAELAARLKPILNALAYSATQSEGAVLGYHEEWRDGITRALGGAAAASEHRPVGAALAKLMTEAAVEGISGRPDPNWANEGPGSGLVRLARPAPRGEGGGGSGGARREKTSKKHRKSRASGRRHGH